MKFGGAGWARRRACAAFGACVLIAGVVGGSTLAGADVGPAGSVTLTISNGELTTSTGVFGPITGTLVGSVDGAGHMNFPKANASFPPFTITASGLEVGISPRAAGDFSGTIDATTGAVQLQGDLITDLRIDNLALEACPLGPIALNLRTGDFGGVAYDPATGTATVGDDDFGIPAISFPTAGCGEDPLGVTLLNSVLMLPNANADHALKLRQDITLSPIITVVDATTSTTAASTTTTTTVAPTTTTTLAPQSPVEPLATTTTTQPPIGNPTNLPFTGSSQFLVVVGLGSILVGGALMLRRRRHAFVTVNRR